MNSSPVNFTIQSYSERGGKSFGTPQVLENVCVPKYNADDPVHQSLSSLSQQAHILAAYIHDTSISDNSRKQSQTQLLEIEAEIDRAAAQLWGLTDAELTEIQKSLKELSDT
jgi:hypothetical protein